MLSKRAKVTKKLVKYGRKNGQYTTDNVKRRRKGLDRGMSILSRPIHGTKYEQVRIGDVSCLKVIPPTHKDRLVLYLHGGGFSLGSAKGYKNFASNVAMACQSKLLLPEYSLAPEHPYPKAINELSELWKKLITTIDPKNIAIMGDSAGGTLTITLTLKLIDEKQPIPACLVLLYPAVDATLSGESVTNKSAVDPILNKRQLEFFVESYIQKLSKTSRYISPLFTDLKGLPPILLQAGTDDILFSDSARFANKAVKEGLEITYKEYVHHWHGWHMFTYLPESKYALKEIGTFINQYLPK